MVTFGVDTTLTLTAVDLVHLKPWPAAGHMATYILTNTTKRLVTFHAICLIIAELSLPTWQKEAGDIKHQVIQAQEEAKK